MRAAIALASVLFALGAAAEAATSRDKCGTEINYDDADIRTVVDEIAMRTGRILLLDPRVQGKVTVKSPPNGGICADEAWELFQSMLRVNGFVATPIGDRKYRVVPIQDSSRAAGPVNDQRAASGDIVTEVVPLRFVDAREAAANLAQIINERGVVTPIRSSNALIVVDTADNVRRIKQIIAGFDRDRTVYRTIPLANANASDVARTVSKIAKQESGEDTSGGPVSIVPVDANNSILIRAEPAVLNRLTNVIAELDRLGGEQADLAVIPLANTDAEEMAKLLRDIAAPPGATAPSGDAAATVGTAGSRATITFHKPTNSVIINADADLQRTLQGVIAQLDVRRAQVLVEAIIVEVSDRAARELGLQYFLSGTDGSAVPFTTTNFQNSSPSILSLAGPTLIETGRAPGGVSSSLSSTLTQTAISSLLGINGFAGGGFGEIGDNLFGAILTAVKEDGGSKILSTPSVVTLDNADAELSVGQEIPITTGEAVGDNFQNAFRQVERKEVGVILKVKPQINEGGTVTLTINQEISSVAGQIIDTSTDLITNKRRISTKALVDDGDILVIGGLVESSSETSATKVPGLGDIPVAGNLFKQSGRTKERRNLMVFLRPTILQDRDSAGAVTRKKIDYLRARDFLYSGEPSNDLERLIKDVTGKDVSPPSAGGGGAPSTPASEPALLGAPQTPSNE
jgi:general secretion pathway protein D